MGTHTTTISFIEDFINTRKFDRLDYDQPSIVSYFSSGGGTHLYLIENGNKKFLFRINFYPGKNEWKVKKAEFEILKEIENLSISPKVFLLNEKNELNQDFTIVEYIEGNVITEFSNIDIVALAKDLKKLHNFPKQFDKSDDGPYKCDIFNEFANGEDKKIEKYDFENIAHVFSKYNSIKKDLGLWFNNLTIFKKCKNLCLCHEDLKSENILRTKDGIRLIDWECAGVNIPEIDIGRLFSGCGFSQTQQDIFLKIYYGDLPKGKIIQRILSVKIVLDFFRIIENYCILKRKVFNARNMLQDLETYQKDLEKAKYTFF